MTHFIATHEALLYLALLPTITALCAVWLSRESYRNEPTDFATKFAAHTEQAQRRLRVVPEQRRSSEFYDVETEGL